MFPADTPPPKKVVRKAPEKEKEPSILVKILPWLLVVIGLSGIGWMVATNAPQKAYHCQSLGGGDRNSLLNIGGCSTD
jgi:hypothetical protein